MYYQKGKGLWSRRSPGRLGMRSGHYEIFITLRSHPPRKDMCNVAPHGLSRSSSMIVEPSQFARRNRAPAHGNKLRKEHLMFDVVVLALGLGFFVAGIGYAYACERL